LICTAHLGDDARTFAIIASAIMLSKVTVCNTLRTAPSAPGSGNQVLSQVIQRRANVGTATLVAAVYFLRSGILVPV
jgi:hypothetical protein